MQRVVLRGRAEPMARALDTLRRAQRTGRPAVLIVTGPAGIGRSAYLRAVANEAASLGFRVGAGGSGDGDATIPGAPLLVALRSGPDPLLGHEAFTSLASLYDREVWLVDRISDLLSDLASRTPLLIVLDDVQGADPLTRFALRLLPARLSGRPVVWALASRGGRNDIVDTVADSAGVTAAVTRVTLGPLGDDDVDDVVRDHLGRAPSDELRDLIRSAGGVPAWVVRLLQGADGDTDSGVPDLDAQAELLRSTRRRLAALPPLASELVRLAAVWDRPLSMSIAASVLAGPTAVQLADAAHNACADGVLERRRDLVVLPHHWVREVVYGDIDTHDRRRLHLRCAQYLRDTGDRLTASGHLRAGAAPGDADAARSLLSAADDQVGSSPNEAATLARSAWALVSEGAPRHQEVAEHALEILHATGRDREAATVADVVLDQLTRDPVDDPVTVGWWQAREIRSLIATSDWDAVRGRLDAATTHRPSDGQPPPAVQAARAVVDAMTAPRSVLADARQATTRLLAAAVSHGDTLTRELAVTAAVSCDRREMRHGSAWRTLAPTTRMSTTALTVERIRTLQDLDRHHAASAELESIGAGATAPPGSGRQTPAALIVAARQDLDLGRLADAYARARALAVIARETCDPVHRDAAAAITAEVDTHHGVDVALDVPTDATVVEWSSGLRVLQAATVARRGDTDAAVRLVLPVAAAYRAGFCATMWSPSWTVMLVRVALAAGDRCLAEQVVAVADGVSASNHDIPSWVGTSQQTSGLLAGDTDLLAAAVHTLRAGPRPLLLATALVDLGLALAGPERADEAVAVLEEAVSLHRKFGATSGAAVAAGALERLGVRHRPVAAADGRPVAGWTSLTDSELVVVRLISNGHTNRSAATELGISPNTVGTHLRSVFGKLGVRSRVQLSNFVHEQG